MRRGDAQPPSSDAECKKEERRSRRFLEAAHLKRSSRVAVPKVSIDYVMDGERLYTWI